MLFARYHIWQLLAAFALLVDAQPAAALGWSDDFNDGNAEDGNPVTWTFNELGATPGVYDASSGDYALSAPGVGGNDDSLLASVNVNFQDTYVRTQAVILPGSQPEEVGGNPGVLARYDPQTLSGYAAILDDGEQYALLRIDGGVAEPLAGEDGIGVDAATDVLMELDVVGDQLSLFFWRPGDPKPDQPLVSVTDATYTSGRAGVIYNEDDDNTAGVFRFAAAQALR